MTPQPLKIRADVEMKCFQFDGVVHIKVVGRFWMDGWIFSFEIVCVVEIDLVLVSIFTGGYEES